MLEILKKSGFFSVFPENALVKFQDSLKIEQYASGEEIFIEGSEGSCMYLISAGEVEISKKGRVLSRFEEGDIFGEMGLFGSDIRSADALAVADCSVIRINNRDFRDFIFRYPEPGCHFLFSAIEEMSLRLRRTSSYLVAVYETGRIIGGDYSEEEMTRRILLRLLEEIKDASGGLVMVYNPYTGFFDEQAASGNVLLNEEKAAELIEKASGEDIFDLREGEVVFGVPCRDAGKIKGFIFIEKKDSSSPPSSNEEIIAAAVANQLALGLVKSETKKDEEARKLFERKKMENS